MRYNKIETEDDWLQLGQKKIWSFYDQANIQKAIRSIGFNDKYIETKNALVQTILYHDRLAVSHERTVYGILDLLGDLGGVTEVFMIFFSFLLMPISYHSFTMKAMKKLYIARTRDEDLFKKPNDKIKSKKTKQKLGDTKDEEQIKKKLTVEIENLLKLGPKDQEEI